MLNTSVSMEFMNVIRDDPFIKEISTCINKLKMGNDYGSQAVLDSKIAQSINDRFGINVRVVVIDDDPYYAGIEIPPLTKTHPFLNYVNRPGNIVGDLLSQLGPRASRVGTVDLVNLKCDGVFSKIPTTIFVDTTLFKSEGFETKHLVAIICHEIGHLIFYYYHLLNSTVANFVTCAIASGIEVAKNDGERKIVIEKGLKVLGVDGVKVGSLLSNTEAQNAADLQAIYISNTKDYLRSETGYSIYELRTSEQMADYFASRLNQSVNLAQGLDLIWRKIGVRATIPKSALMIETAISATLMLGKSVLSLGVAVPYIYNTILKQEGVDARIYDTPKQRIEMFKRYVVQDLKKRNKHDMAFYRETINQFDELSKIADQLNDYPTLTQWLARKIIPFARLGKSQVDIQKNIEELLYNEVYVLAARFQTLQS